MINILLVFDEEDLDIGSFNTGCREDFEALLNEANNHNITYINSRSLNSLNIEMRTQELESFIFVAYSHGDVNRLYSSDGDYVSTSVNSTYFNNTFFYTVSCNTAMELGQELINQGCKCYFGYRKLFNSWLGYKDFSDCANFGFFKFIEGVETNTIYKLMINKYNEHIDNLYKDNFIQASLLLENRDGLVKLGNNITIDEFY